jgi:hypothetical protein
MKEYKQNYKVVMTFNREEIITKEQYEKLTQVLYNGEHTFVKINDIIVQVRDVRLIEPTEEKTAKENEEEKQRILNELFEKETEGLKQQEFLTFQFQELNNRYPNGWVRPNSPLIGTQHAEGKTIVSEEEMQELIDRWNEHQG